MLYIFYQKRTATLAQIKFVKHPYINFRNGAQNLEPKYQRRKPQSSTYAKNGLTMPNFTTLNCQNIVIWLYLLNYQYFGKKKDDILRSL